MAVTLDFKKTPSDKTLAWAIAPSGGALGVTDVDVPTADELNNAGGASAMQPLSQSVAMADTDLGFQASETDNDPSFADSSTAQSLTTTNYGGSLSMYYPKNYDDDSNLHSLVYDMTEHPGDRVDVAVRNDGYVPVTQPYANGDFVHVMRLEVSGELNPFDLGQDTKRTVPFIPVGEFSHYTIVGPHTITAIAPTTWAVGDKGRIRASVQNRDYTNALDFTTTNAAVIDVYPGGFYTVVGTGTASVVIVDEGAGTSTTVSVTVA